MSLRDKISRTSARMSELVNQYGPIAIGVWMTLFFLVLTGAYVGITLGLDIGSTVSGKGGAFAMAYGATMITKPVRAIITLAVTPLVAQLLKRRAQPNDPVA